MFQLAGDQAIVWINLVELPLGQQRLVAQPVVNRAGIVGGKSS